MRAEGAKYARSSADFIPCKPGKPVVARSSPRLFAHKSCIAIAKPILLPEFRVPRHFLVSFLKVGVCLRRAPRSQSQSVPIKGLPDHTPMELARKFVKRILVSPYPQPNLCILAVPKGQSPFFHHSPQATKNRKYEGWLVKRFAETEISTPSACTSMDFTTQIRN